MSSYLTAFTGMDAIVIARRAIPADPTEDLELRRVQRFKTTCTATALLKIQT